MKTIASLTKEIDAVFTGKTLRTNELYVSRGRYGGGRTITSGDKIPGEAVLVGVQTNTNNTSFTYMKRADYDALPEEWRSVIKKPPNEYYFGYRCESGYHLACDIFKVREQKK